MKADIDEDLEFCREVLRDVSRTFAKPIELLPEPLRVALTCGYLLCRVVDTVEDYAPLASDERDQLFTAFIAVLDGERSADSFSERFLTIGDGDAEIRLAQSLPRVMRVFERQGLETRRATTTWLSEMANGMRVYCRRESRERLWTLNTFSDLERYCYFVAGTVGHLITDLFCDWIGDSSSSLEHELRARCESFGVGLQLVNILKDITDDFARSRCYVPRQLCRAEGLAPERLLGAEQRHQAHRALSRMCERAAEHLEAGFEYALLIPAEQAQLRLFCLLPLWMAIETLIVAVGNDALLIDGHPVKISRDTVSAIVEDCLRHVSDDAALRQLYESSVARFEKRLAALVSSPRLNAADPDRHAQL